MMATVRVRQNEAAERILGSLESENNRGNQSPTAEIVAARE